MKIVFFTLSIIEDPESISFKNFLQAEIVYISPKSVRLSVRKSPNLGTTTLPKQLDGLSGNFREIFLKVSLTHIHCLLLIFLQW